MTMLWMGTGWAVFDGVQEYVKHARQDQLGVDKAEGGDRHGSGALDSTMVSATAAGAKAFDQDGPQHAQPVTEGVQIAHPVDPGMLETWNLDDLESCLRYPHMDQCLDLEAVAPQPSVASD